MTVEEAKARLLREEAPARGAGAGAGWSASPLRGGRSILPLVAGALVAGALVGRMKGVGKLLTIGMLVARSPVGRAAAMAVARSASRRVSARRAGAPAEGAPPGGAYPGGAYAGWASGAGARAGAERWW